MTLKATVVGSIELQSKLKKVSERSVELVKHAVFKGVADVEKEAKLSIQRGGKSGVVYQKYNPKRNINLLLHENHQHLILVF